MGLEQRSGSGGTYLNVMAGKLVQTVGPDTSGAVKRENKNKKIVYEIHHDTLSGIITDVKIEDSNFGKRFNMTVNDNGQNFYVQIQLQSAYGRSFLMKMKEMNFDENIKIAPYNFEDKDKAGKMVSGITFTQGGDKLPNTWNRESEELPDMKQVVVSGKDTWDDTDRMKFLAGEFTKLKFGAAVVTNTPAAQPVDETKDELKDAMQEDDLPF